MLVAVAAVMLGASVGVPGAELDLFPVGKVPGEVPGAVGPEYWENHTSANGETGNPSDVDVPHTRAHMLIWEGRLSPCSFPRARVW